MNPQIIAGSIKGKNLKGLDQTQEAVNTARKRRIKVLFTVPSIVIKADEPSALASLKVLALKAGFPERIILKLLNEAALFQRKSAWLN